MKYKIKYFLIIYMYTYLLYFLKITFYFQTNQLNIENCFEKFHTVIQINLIHQLHILHTFHLNKSMPQVLFPFYFL